ncbi:SDR family NAD(P)-dependent oxidoreductase [Pelagibius sp. Alg239-R121]|uniref:SDR family NAD(P)-dependent oxidoreductase n=1 Tax=Pelagibius sp. Alg239-R121 TaxID=2993448 RepID=UPI0024A66A4C|nr:SDR family oxidoreductase [Pelagibius sp. Alg239-R121]
MDNPMPTVLVTGGASGIGAAICRLIVERGGSAGIIDLDEDKGTALANELGENAGFARADICDETQLTDAYEKLEGSLPPIGGLVTCAGVSPTRLPIEDYPLEEFRRLLDNHASGTFLTCKVVGSKLTARGGGAIVTISSALSVRPGPMLGYGAGKAAVLNLTQSLAVHWGKQSLRVNTIVPGWVDTPFIRRQEEAGRDLSPIRGVTPMGRLVKPEEVAEVAWFLLSPAASAMTGAAVVVDCGVTLGGGWLPYGELP